MEGIELLINSFIALAISGLIIGFLLGVRVGEIKKQRKNVMTLKNQSKTLGK